MIERQIVAQKVREKQIEEYIFSIFGRQNCSHVKMQRTPLGEKISVYTSKPGLIVGKRGTNIKKVTDMLKTKFKMENPELEVVEIENPYLDAASVARNLINGFERFGPKRFKAMAYKALEDSIRAGAKGIEIVISGRGVPGERAKSWRFLSGYLKKSGDISESFMDRANEACNLRSGTVGIKVSILHPDVMLPDSITLRQEKKQEVQASEEKKEDGSTEKK
ncbi:MAG TPA: 30S ribosomal protein S3 [Candidatus Nanoarchaeia archaeon]|nr:30S ribosomal protein S3 [Candidatus Nanoarchaeia archaeon]